MKNPITILIFMLCLEIVAQHIKKGDVLRDFNVLIDNIERYNPALSTFQPKFQDLAAEVIQSVHGDSISIFSYFSKVSEICALANEGHFKIGNWNDIVHKGFGTNTYSYLPIEVKVISGKLFVLKDYSNEKRLNKGDEIIGLNGLKTERTLNYLLKLIPSDGEIQTYIYHKIEEGFPWLYYLHVQQTKTHRLTILDENRKRREVEITALNKSEQVKNYKKYYAEKNLEEIPLNNSFYKLDIKDNHALLVLPSFDFRRVNKFKVRSKKLYKSIFKELKDQEVENLIVDLRNNTGGRNEFADDMVPYVLKQNNGNAFLKKTVSWEGKEKTYALPKVSKLAFNGKIYVLTNGKTFSAGSTLARYLKEYGNAKVIGTETGTRYEGFVAGSRQEIFLSNSGIKIGIPRYHILFPSSEKQSTLNRGLLPDYNIALSFQESVEGKDVYLEKIMDLIKNGNQLN